MRVFSLRSLLAASLLFLLVPGPASAQGSGEPTPETYGSTVSGRYAAAAKRFLGTVGSGFEGVEEGDCLAGRTVTVLRLRPGPDKKMGTTATTATGSWSLPARPDRGRYVVRVAGAEFVYSPSYGQLVRVICSPTSAQVVVQRSFRNNVLGLHVTRGASAGSAPARSVQDPTTEMSRAASRGAPLPLTGAPIAPFVWTGFGSLALGSIALSLSAVWRRRSRASL